jgi:hypothetical protein
LTQGVNRGDLDNEVIPELGYSLSLHTGGANEGYVSLRIYCGCYSPWVGNNLVLMLPASGPHSLEQAQEEARLLFENLVSVWQPDQGILCDAVVMRWEGPVIARNIPAYARHGA